MSTSKHMRLNTDEVTTTDAVWKYS